MLGKAVWRVGFGVDALGGLSASVEDQMLPAIFSQEVRDELVTSFKDRHRKQNVMDSGPMAMALVKKPDYSPSWREDSTLSADWLFNPLLCPPSPCSGDLRLQVSCARRERPRPCGSACLFPPLATCLRGRHGHTSGPVC